MKRWLSRLVAFVLIFAAVAALGIYWLVRHQGGTPEDYAAYEGAKISVDADGIPTIEADSWEAVVEAQGYVVASQRFWHMDLIRRASSGRLAELFGAAAVPLDEKRRLEDWQGVAEVATKALSADDRKLVDAYARGVNRFLESHRYRVSLEYLVLGAQPEPWSARDTLFIVSLMSEQLATAAPSEALRARWRDALGPEWFDFLYPVDHPWNEPLFGVPDASGPKLPAQKLPMAEITPAELARRDEPSRSPEERLAGLYDDDVAGWGASNSWAWCGHGQCFLANDPHLAASVPHLWFLTRLRVSEKEWAVGVAIPGTPGVVIGMNPYLAWALTNVGEDVDDYLLEEVSEDGTKYVEKIEDGQKVWAPIETKTHVIHVKDAPDVTVTSKRTSRGPLAQREYLGEGWYARRWLPLEPGMARPAFGVPRAKNWAELNAAFDEWPVPAQNALMVDRSGNIGYRACGTGIRRKTTGRFPQSALEADWEGVYPPKTRPRMLFYVREPDPQAPRFIATANERIWVDDDGHQWTEDLRKDRIRSVLGSKEKHTRADMEALQMDTHSRYHHIMLDWLATHAVPSNDPANEVVARWKAWDGVAEGHVETFTEAIEAERLLLAVCLGRVREHLMDGVSEAELPYNARLDSAWVLTMLQTKGASIVFGLSEEDLATSIVEKIAASKLEPYPKGNRWQAQHGFVGRVPVIGDWFRIPETEQIGWSSVPRVERPKFGASSRMVWDLTNPLESTWVTPVGQSGHPFSPFFSNLVTRYHENRRLKVFDDAHTWWFSPPGVPTKEPPAD